MRYAICTVPAAAVRKENAHRTEMVNQLLFGETMEILEEDGEWFRIKSFYDDYEGWLTHHLIMEADENIARGEVNFVTEGLINTIQFRDQLIIAPMGSALPGFSEQTNSFWNGEFHGSYRNLKSEFTSEDIISTAQEWLNAPYLWGGKTF